MNAMVTRDDVVSLLEYLNETASFDEDEQVRDTCARLWLWISRMTWKEVK
jgi:hypothetical protein